MQKLLHNLIYDNFFVVSILCTLLLYKGNLKMCHSHSTETKEAFEVIQQFCIDTIVKSEAGNILSCLLAAKDGFLNQTLINSIKNDTQREALKAVLLIQEGHESNLSLSTIENRWLRAYTDFAYRTRI